MSIELQRATEAHRQRVASGMEGLSRRFRLVVILLSVCILLLFVMMGVIWHGLSRDPVVILPPPYRWKVEKMCFRSKLTFRRDESDACESIDAQADAQHACDWQFKNGEMTLLQFLNTPAAGDQRQRLITIYGGHDAVPMISNDRFDSNFDLAQRRAATVRSYVESLMSDASAAGDAIVSLAIATSRADLACTDGATREAEQQDQGVDAGTRRSPVLQIIQWTLQQ